MMRVLAVSSLVLLGAGCSRREDPCALPDADQDRLPDAWEVAKYRTDPRSKDTDGDGRLDSEWLERREFTYTLRVVLEFAAPLRADEPLDTVFQDVRVLDRRGSSTELEVVLYPGATSGAGVPKYRAENRCLRSALEGPLPERAFAQEMTALAGDAPTSEVGMRGLLARLYAQTRRTVPFNAFSLSIDAGVATVEPRARRLLSEPDASLAELWSRELDPATMWRRRERGECTSTAVLGAAALRATGVPSRLALFIPVAAAPEAVLQDVWDRRVLAGARPSGGGCTSHTAVESLLEDRWLVSDESGTTSSPLQLGMGPLVQLRTAATVGELIEPEFWGAACAGQGPLEGTRNVYRLLRVSDAWGPHTEELELDFMGRAPPQVVRITDVFPFDSPKRPSFIPADAVVDPTKSSLGSADVGDRSTAELGYFYRCVDKSHPPFRFVRGHWKNHFLLESIEDVSAPEAPPRAASQTCRWLVEDREYRE